MSTKRPSRAYSAMFSGLFFGSFFLVTGLIGYRIGRHGAILADSRWAGQPIGWQIAYGVVFLLIGVYFLRRLGLTRWTVIEDRARRVVKNVGQGRSSGAQRTDEQRSLPASATLHGSHEDTRRSLGH